MKRAISMSRLHVVTFIAALLGMTACSEAPVSPTTTLGATSSLAVGPPAYEPGEQQLSVDLTRGTLAIYPAGVGQNLAQTFTPSRNGWLGYLELPVGCASGVLLNVKILEGLGGSVLYEANYAGLPEVVDGDFELHQVYNPAESAHGIRLHKRRTYAFQLAALPGPSAVGNTCGLAHGPAANSYARGRGFYQDPPLNGPTFLPLPNGLPTDDEDLPFRTLVR